MSKKAKQYLSNGFGSVLTHTKDGILRGSGAFVSLSDKSDNENLSIRDIDNREQSSSSGGSNRSNGSHDLSYAGY